MAYFLGHPVEDEQKYIHNMNIDYLAEYLHTTFF